MPNQRRPGWTSRGIAMPDDLWSALRARVSKPELPSVGAVVRAACEAYVAAEARDRESAQTAYALMSGQAEAMRLADVSPAARQPPQ